MDLGDRDFYGHVHAELLPGIAERTARNLVKFPHGKAPKEKPRFFFGAFSF